MKKKILVFSTALVLALALLAGCQAEPPSASTPTPPPPSQSVAPQPSAEPSLRATQYGPVRGLQEEELLIFYAVPYGANPVGELRWQSPAAPTPWTEPRACTMPTEMAMQLAASYDAQGNRTTALAGTTDCLNLDIYTATTAESLPVFVYLHGGNNQTGNSLDFDGRMMVTRDDCVVVSVNYRLGLLGFQSLPALTQNGQTGNFALEDMAAALTWIQENIAEFGGDPNRVTVSGFSAGGRDVMAMLVSPLFENLFQQAIAFSGGMTIADPAASARQTANLLAPLAVEDGQCPDEASAAAWLLEETEDVRAYLHSLSDERLTNLMTDAGIRMSAFPHLFGDDISLPRAGFAGDYVNDVPLIMLTGTTEFSLFGNWDGYLFSLGDAQGAAREFARTHGSAFYGMFNAQYSAQEMAERYDSEIYLCEISYGGATSPTSIADLGAFHGVFLPMISATHGYAGFHDFEQAGYLDMSEAFHGYLRSFLHTGSPNGADAPTAWTQWDNESQCALVFDADEATGTASVVLARDTYRSPEELLAAMDADDTLAPETKRGVIAHVLNGRWFSDAIDRHYENANLWRD